MANLTNKELAAIKDQITTEQALICKYNVYAQTISDQHLSQKCKEIAQKHQQHYNKLMAQLN
ncbi:MAG: spore coat protein [Clostridia bacterium]|nr:spore coat protein [Clostridia bacterium]